MHKDRSFPNKTSVADSEVVARYAFSTKWFSVTENRLKHNAFIPHPRYPDELSVYRMDKLNESEIWEIGWKMVGVCQKPPRPPRARGDMKASEIRALKKDEGTEECFDLFPETKPHPRHANIVNIKSVSKGQEKVIATKLANLTNLSLNPNPISSDED